MKKTIIAAIILAILAMCVAATAQVTRTHAKAGANTQARANNFEGGKAICDKLGLTQEQKQQIGEIVKGYFTEIKPIIKSDATPEQKKAQIEPIRAKAIDAIMAILTPEQQQKAREMNLPERMLRPMKNRADGMKYALGQLNLTDQQKTQIKGIMEASREKAKAIKENTNLTQDQKKAQFKELRESTHQQVMSVLTPEQQQKLNDMIQQRKQKTQENSQTLNKRAGQKTRTK